MVVIAGLVRFLSVSCGKCAIDQPIVIYGIVGVGVLGVLSVALGYLRTRPRSSGRAGEDTAEWASPDPALPAPDDER